MKSAFPTLLREHSRFRLAVPSRRPSAVFPGRGSAAVGGAAPRFHTSGWRFPRSKRLYRPMAEADGGGRAFSAGPPLGVRPLRCVCSRLGRSAAPQLEASLCPPHSHTHAAFPRFRFQLLVPWARLSILTHKNGHGAYFPRGEPHLTRLLFMGPGWVPSDRCPLPLASLSLAAPWRCRPPEHRGGVHSEASPLRCTADTPVSEQPWAWVTWVFTRHPEP